MNLIKKNEKTLIKHVLAFAVLLAAFVIMNSKAEADAIDYLNSNYKGTVTRDTGADMYTEPGTVNPKVTKADGTPVHLDTGTEIFITSEEVDGDLDVWYKCQVTLDGVDYEGYVYTGRVTRGDAVPFTPTPTPLPTPTPAEIATDSLPGPDIQPTDPGVDDGTRDMIEDSNTFKPWKWIIILVIVILVFMIIYTVWVKTSEDKLEREIERYSNRPQYEPLEGELDEDFEEAKASYYDHIGLGDQTNKSLGEVIGNPEDVQLDMTGIFDDAPKASQNEEKAGTDSYSYANDSSLKSLIASLEKKLGEEPSEDEEDDEVTADVEAGDSKEPEDTVAVKDEASPFEDYEAEADGADAEAVEDLLPESDGEMNAYEEKDATKGKTEPVVPEFVKRAESRKRPAPAPKPEKKPEKNAYVEPGLAEMFEDDEDDESDAYDLRDMLDNLSEGDTLIHKSYGEGIVEDNTDAQIIQVRFGDDVRYLKKEKLIKKNLVQL